MTTPRQPSSRDYGRKGPRGDRHPLLDRADVAINEGPGPEYLYRPGQILVATEDRSVVEGPLRAAGWAPSKGQASKLGVLRYAPVGTDARQDVPLLVSRLRSLTDKTGRPPRVAPNQVLLTSSHLRWFGGGEPIPSHDRLDIPQLAYGRGPTVAVVDTGLDDHPSLAGHAARLSDSADRDPLDEDHNGLLDTAAGHGTFVTGAVAEVAPAARIIDIRVPDAGGVTDDLTLSLALARLSRIDVCNLSLGGYAHDNTPPFVLEQAIGLFEARNPKAVIVAAAGNDGVDQPMYPAAFKRVIAVGALGPKNQPATFPLGGGATNHGRWVDACAQGVDVLSTYVNGKRDDGRGVVAFHGWARWSGTSFSAAHVSGVIAARMISDGIDAREAAFRSITAIGLTTVPGLGTIVN